MNPGSLHCWERYKNWMSSTPQSRKRFERRKQKDCLRKPRLEDFHKSLARQVRSMRNLTRLNLRVLSSQKTILEERHKARMTRTMKELHKKLEQKQWAPGETHKSPESRMMELRGKWT